MLLKGIFSSIIVFPNQSVTYKLTDSLTFYLFTYMIFSSVFFLFDCLYNYLFMFIFLSVIHLPYMQITSRLWTVCTRLIKSTQFSGKKKIL